MSSKIILVGTGTCQIWKHRVASSVLFQVDNQNILYDIGHGVLQRLIDFGVRHDQIGHLFISHIHPDHVSEVIPLLHGGSYSRDYPRKKPISVYGTKETIDLIKRTIELFNLDVGYYKIQLTEVIAGEIKIGGVSFETALLPPAGNHGLKLKYQGRTYAATGDAEVGEEAKGFLTNIDVAIIDAGHPTVKEIVDLGVRAQPKRLICSHIYQEIDVNQLEKKLVKRGFRGKVEVGEDLQIIELDKK